MDRKLRTTARHFVLFRQEAERLQKYWGLNDMKIYFHHGRRDSRGTFAGRDTKRVGTLTLSTHWEDIDPSGLNQAISDDEIREVARHEMVHALVLPVTCLIADFTTKDEAERAEEALVQRLMRILPTRESRR